MVNEYEILVLLKQVWMYERKTKNFGKERKENKFKLKLTQDTFNSAFPSPIILFWRQNKMTKPIQN